MNSVITARMRLDAVIHRDRLRDMREDPKTLDRFWGNMRLWGALVALLNTCDKCGYRTQSPHLHVCLPRNGVSL